MKEDVVETYRYVIVFPDGSEEMSESEHWREFYVKASPEDENSYFKVYSCGERVELFASTSEEVEDVEN